MAEGAEICTGLLILVGIVLMVWIFFKLLKYGAYLGQYRTGKAMKKISREGLNVNYNPPSQQPVRSGPQYHGSGARLIPGSSLRFCNQCNATIQPGFKICPYCGNGLM